jgi:hypothetical protein
MRRNVFRGPAYANLDMSITKRWKLSERMNLQLRGEFFNVLNHPNFNLFSMRTDVSDPVFGINDLGGSELNPGRGRRQSRNRFGRIASHPIGCETRLVRNYNN